MATDVSTIKGVFIFDQNKQVIYGNFTENIMETVRNLQDFRTCVMNKIIAANPVDDQQGLSKNY